MSYDNLSMDKEPCDYEKIYAFENLYKAHLKARRGKRDLAETILFENNLGINLIRISEELRNGTYRID